MKLARTTNFDRRTTTYAFEVDDKELFDFLGPVERRTIERISCGNQVISAILLLFGIAMRLRITSIESAVDAAKEVQLLETGEMT